MAISNSFSDMYSQQYLSQFDEIRRQEYLQMQRLGARNMNPYAHCATDPGHSHGNALLRAIEDIQTPTTAPKNEIPDEVLLLLEV